MNEAMMQCRTECYLEKALTFAYVPAFGDELAQRQGYRKHRGLEAIYFYLVEKYRWLPSQARSLSDEDLMFLLEEEMADWTPPGELVAAVHDALAESAASDRRAAAPALATFHSQEHLASKPPQKSRALDARSTGFVAPPQ